jgi:endo-1,4-beta-xylanase
MSVLYVLTVHQGRSAFTPDGKRQYDLATGYQSKYLGLGCAKGLQGHWAVNEPSREQLEQTLKDFSTRLKMQITELDISVYPKEHNARQRNETDADTIFTIEKQQQQQNIYKMAFELFRQYGKQISGVTFWNISDRHSWLDNFPVRGRKDYPSLFDSHLERKQVYKDVTEFE